MIRDIWYQDDAAQGVATVYVECVAADYIHLMFCSPLYTQAQLRGYVA